VRHQHILVASPPCLGGGALRSPFLKREDGGLVPQFARLSCSDSLTRLAQMQARARRHRRASISRYPENIGLASDAASEGRPLSKLTWTATGASGSVTR